MDQFKDIAAWIMLFSIIGVLLIALALGIKAIWNHILGYGTYKAKQREDQEAIAAYKAQVEELKLKAKATEVVAS